MILAIPDLTGFNI